jgi:Holliday junction resolvase-like predicted endonuclease
VPGNVVVVQLRQANPRKQGDLGELAAMEWLGRKGYNVWVPLFHSRDVDLIATRETEVLRVQVKTSTRLTQYGAYQVMVCTRGGNQSWNGVAKEFDAAAVDYLFVLVADGRRWFIPATAITAKSAICVGRKTLGEYEVEPWSALIAPGTLFSAETLS